MEFIKLITAFAASVLVSRHIEPLNYFQSLQSHRKDRRFCRRRIPSNRAGHEPSLSCQFLSYRSNRQRSNLRNPCRVPGLPKPCAQVPVCRTFPSRDNLPPFSCKTDVLLFRSSVSLDSVDRQETFQIIRIRYCIIVNNIHNRVRNFKIQLRQSGISISRRIRSATG